MRSGEILTNCRLALFQPWWWQTRRRSNSQKAAKSTKRNVLRVAQMPPLVHFVFFCLNFHAESGVGPRSDFGRAVSRILSARLPGERIICLSSQYPGPIPSKRKLKRAASWSPIWPCSRWGFPCPVDYSTGGGLLPRLFTLTFATEAAPAVCFLWHSPSESLSAVPPACIPDGLRGIAPCGVRTFLPQLAPGAILRPSKIVLSLGLAFREHKGRNHYCEIDSKASPSSADFEWQAALKRAALSDTTGARWFIGSPTARLLVFRRGFDPNSASL